MRMQTPAAVNTSCLLLLTYNTLFMLQLAAWRLRKFEELNAPMAAGDKWVHVKVLQGKDQPFL